MVIDDELLAEIGEVSKPLHWNRNDRLSNGSEIPKIYQVSGFMCVENKECGIATVVEVNFDFRMALTESRCAP